MHVNIKYGFFFKEKELVIEGVFGIDLNSLHTHIIVGVTITTRTALRLALFLMCAIAR